MSIFHFSWGKKLLLCQGHRGCLKGMGVSTVTFRIAPSAQSYVRMAHCTAPWEIGDSQTFCPGESRPLKIHLLAYLPTYNTPSIYLCPTDTHASKHARMYACTHTHMHACKHTHMQANTNTQRHIDTHTTPTSWGVLSCVALISVTKISHSFQMSIARHFKT